MGQLGVKAKGTGETAAFPSSGAADVLSSTFGPAKSASDQAGTGHKNHSVHARLANRKWV